MKDFIKSLSGKSIHVVGATGAEGSNILRLLKKYKLARITVHDFLKEGSIERSFKLWHKRIPKDKRSILFTTFLDDLEGVDFCSGNNYLKDITSADVIFVPQSWRLYSINKSLWEAKKRNIQFYSLTRLYLDLAKAKIIAVTGTVGKGSVANALTQILRLFGKKVYFAGNETWMLQVADRIDEMGKNDFLILEVSHRQLQDGFTKAPHIAIITNIYPNHLDEISWEKYKELKLSLLKLQGARDISIINYDNLQLKNYAEKLNSKVYFYSELNKNMNTKNIQKYYKLIMSKKSIHYPVNLLASLTAVDALGLDVENAIKDLSKTSPLPSRFEFVGKVDGVNFYNDIKSTTPWAALAALRKITGKTILICGGKTKGIDYKSFVLKVKNDVEYVILLQSQLSKLMEESLPKDKYLVVDHFDQAIFSAYGKARHGDSVLISPAAGFFYSDFLKGKFSLRKLITSLPPKAQG